MKMKYISMVVAVVFLWASLTSTASAAIMQGLPSDKNCTTACDCTKCCTENFNTFYKYGASEVSADDWWAWYNADQPDGVGCDEIALVAWFATAILCIFGGQEVLHCLAFAWMVYYIDLIICHNSCENDVCG